MFTSPGSAVPPPPPAKEIATKPDSLQKSYIITLHLSCYHSDVCFSAWQLRGFAAIVYIPRFAVVMVMLMLKRHMFRGEPDRDERVGGCDRQALPLAEALLERGWQRGLSAEQHVFALMPLRHTPRYIPYTSTNSQTLRCFERVDGEGAPSMAMAMPAQAVNARVCVCVPCDDYFPRRMGVSSRASTALTAVL